MARSGTDAADTSSRSFIETASPGQMRGSPLLPGSAACDKAETCDLARNAVGQQRDGEAVEVRAIVIEDDPVVLGQQVGGRAGTVGLEQGGHLGVGDAGGAGRDDS